MQNAIRQLAFFLLFFLLPALADAQEKIRVTYANNSLTFLAAFIAKDRGFYARNGLAAELIQARPAVNIAALLSGDVDYAEVFGSAIRSAARGAPVRAFSNSIKAPFFSLIAHPSIKSVKELRGRVVGVTSIGGTNQISGRLLFQHFGVDPDKDIKFLAIGEEKFVVNAYSRDGRVDQAGVENLLDMERKAGLIPKTMTVDQVIDASIAEEVLKEMGR